MEQMDAASGSESATPDTGERPLVAVVDDDEAVRTLVARVLTAYDVRTFALPQAALRAFVAGVRPQLILSDVQMPGMNGFELHAEVRRFAPLRGVPFVYLTAMDDRDSLRRGMVQGADDYLTKPFTPNELRQAVAVRLSRHAALTDPAAAGLRLTSLGGLALAAGGARLCWEARNVVTLLAYLLDHGGGASVNSVRRGLWSGPSADNHLHVLVSRLRKTLAEHGRAGVAEDRVWLELRVPPRWDVAEFEAASARAADGARAAIEAAIAAYGGEFLGGFDGPWVETRRAELEGRYIDLLEAAIEAAPEGPERRRARARFEHFLDLV
jgi:two-component SAPR family response regulator